MKAIYFLPTLLLFCSAWSLPKLNNAAECEKGGHLVAGKIIKAATNSPYFLNMPAEADTLGTPELTIYRRKGGLSINTVVIDPGHGGHDPGCHGRNTKEKHVCLAVGKYFAEAIKDNFPDVNVIMTRSTDVFIPLNERAAIATRNKADLFISIHCNAIPNANRTVGTETYVLGLHATNANLEVAKRENESILLEEDYQKNYDGYDPNSPEAHIILSMFQNAFLEQSLRFADKVQNHSNIIAKRKNRGVKQAGFLVLRHATMPSVLVETGFLTNAAEEAYLRTNTGQKAMANALLSAFSEYKSEMEGSAPARLAMLNSTDSEDGNDTATLDDEKATTAEETTFVKPVKQQESTPLTNSKPEKTKPQVAVEEPQKSTKPATEVVNLPMDKQARTNGYTKILVEIPVSESTPINEKPIIQNADIQYRVQLAASPKQLDVNTGKWARVDYLIQVIEENGLFKYQVINFATQEEATAAKTKLRAIGFSDAFVVSYQNGTRLK
ncbi:MAG: N-acetylmuramoyl-L-alanine amidase [Saprospiraceae bacterium]|nr:N-acetylmuramoyl-L-alanine amidase [Saprospiraceae bacterium]MCF8248359.1 N-acetylmuramoyl-L-alanine amidase [Saprospiraceae bacterium]MCF8280202.1 N-acetylmuramoyl-L-alanine amidase [Bacteroidales bacterium]MCF8309887.1 N-acetylmuramoyl-L-alanine amidase [Saprospiraceae bacterium]MCF8438782.1 N-acetylmuramoyl-L-alanine amidase [Saprospiraceae bacterium]